MLRPYVVDPSSAAEVALRPREGEVVLLEPELSASECPVALVLQPAGNKPGMLVPLGRGWATTSTGVTIDLDDLTSDVLEAPLECALDAARTDLAPRLYARVAGRVSRTITDALRAAASLPPYEPGPCPRVTLPEAVGLVDALGVYPDDFAFFRLEDAERARCRDVVVRICAAMSFDRLSGVQFGLAGALAGIVLERAESCGAPGQIELLWFSEGVEDLEGRNAGRPPELRAALVRDGDLTMAIYPDVPEIVELVMA